MCTLYLLVTKLHGVIRHQTHDSRVHNIEELATSCMVVYLAFEARMHTLMRGWRSQGRDIELQLGRYADGLFYDFHREVWPPFVRKYNILTSNHW